MAITAADIRPYWFLVAGFVLLYIFALMFYRPGGGGRHYHPTGILPGETRHMLYEGFSAAHTFYMFGTDWCPHCRSAKPEFEKLGPTMTIDGKTVALKYVDADSNKQMAAEYKVEGYPTFVLESNGQRQKYSGARDLEAFRSFLTKSLA
jgi:thiol-disulfide isomerase/thioredoxin